LELIGCTQVRVEVILEPDIVIERMDLRFVIDLSVKQNVPELVCKCKTVSSDAIQHLKLIDVDGAESVREETIDVKIPLEIRKRDDIELELKLDNFLDRDRRSE
jgi:hypothetical protein